MLIWRIDPESRRFTIGMLVAAAGALLFLPEIGEQTVDPATRFAGANLSNLATQIATVVACYFLVTGAHPSGWTPARHRYWGAYCLASGGTMLASYLLGDKFDTPADQFGLWDSWSRVGYWSLALMILVSFAALAGIALANLSGVDLRLAMALTLLLGVVGVAVGATIAVRLAMDPDWLHAHYRDLITCGATPALIALALSGMPGLVMHWKHREDPR